MGACLKIFKRVDHEGYSSDTIKKINARRQNLNFDYDSHRHMTRCMTKSFSQSSYSRVRAAYHESTTDEEDEILSTTSLYDLPLEVLDIVLQKSYFHWISKSKSELQSDEEIIKSLASVDVCCFQRITRRRFKKTIWRCLEVVIKVEVRNCGITDTEYMDPKLIHQRIMDLIDGRSNQTDELIRQLKEEEIEFLNTLLHRQTLVVWIWCRSQSAIENVQKLYESSQLKALFFGFKTIGSSTSKNIGPKVIDIDRNQFKKTVVVAHSISINLAERINIGRNEVVRGVTTLRNQLYLLCQSFPLLIRVFEGRNPFRLQEEIEINEIEDPMDIGSSEKENCLYVSDQREKCVWKITKVTYHQHKTIRWLTVDYAPQTLSVSINGHLLLVTSSILNFYGSDAKLLRSIQLPRDTENSIHAVETSIGNFFILHQWMEKEEEHESGTDGGMEEWMWVVSELTRDGQMVIRRFIPSNETQKLNNPRYLTIDSDDQVFVADTGNDRVILLDSDLKWTQICCPTAEEEQEEAEKTRIRMPLRSCYDERRKLLIIGGGYFYLGGFNIYNLSRDLYANVSSTDYSSTDDSTTEYLESVGHFRMGISYSSSDECGYFCKCI